jgi:hypothetical protein
MKRRHKADVSSAGTDHFDRDGGTKFEAPKVVASDKGAGQSDDRIMQNIQRVRKLSDKEAERP